MLKTVEFGLLAVSVLVFLALLVTRPARRRWSEAEEEARRASPPNPAKHE